MSGINFTGDPAIIRWSKVMEDVCSYCEAAIPEDAVPLRLWKQNGEFGAQFCDRCAEQYFGMKFFQDEYHE